MHAATREIPFKVQLPFEVWEKSGPEQGKRRRIGGIISTDKTDRQGEIVLQRGLDFSDFLKNGWFNDNHSKDTSDILGFPEKVRQVKHRGRTAHYVEGYLLDNYDKADRIWNLAQALQKTNRRLGFSIEGSVVERTHDGKTIAKAKVRNVAITNCPVNDDTGLECLAKAMIAVEHGLYKSEPDRLAKIEADLDEIKRALTAGQAISNPGTAPGQGFPLRTESMEPQPKKRRRRRKLTKSEAIKFLHWKYPGMTLAKAERILSYVAARQAA